MIDAAHVKDVDERADVFEQLALSVVEVRIHVRLLSTHIEQTDNEVLEKAEVGSFYAKRCA